jgi:poly-gamma-glutamate synthesis protein (capsule biosynthesis protein)
MSPSRTVRCLLTAGLLSLAVAACSPISPVPSLDGSQTAAGEAGRSPTASPFRPVDPTVTVRPVTVWISPALPQALRQPIETLAQQTVGQVEIVAQSDMALVRAEPDAQVGLTLWVYALVAPFPTVQDAVTSAELEAAWQGEGRFFLEETTRQTWTARWGLPAEEAANVAPAADLLDQVWGNRPAFAIVPFEALEPRWKVIEVDGISPIRRSFVAEDYPLTVAYGLSGDPDGVRAVEGWLAAGGGWPASNRNPDRLTVVLMTGVTALTRATAWRMEARGVEYPGLLIGDWLREADLTHTSNEVAFADDCPPPDPLATSLRFCSNPDHLGLLEDVGIDLIELTGNHVLDWGRTAFLESLKLYGDLGIGTFGGGADLEQALRPFLFEHNGNRIAFLGCNQAGPSEAWAGSDRPGAAPCEERMYATVASLRAEGFLPIFTFQWYESYNPVPLPTQVAAFRAPIDAGAVIVSGSQAHRPQAFEFYADHLIHYGLGNLFFDQMWSVPTRQELLDRHVFYEGRHISTEVLTAYLEDYAQPRPMTPDERAALLEGVFAASGW